jgi:quercetin 2,3-dioxygenase
MSIRILRAEERGRGSYGWLQARYSFSFAGYHDPARMGFGRLRVLNDDRIAGGGGFETHPHRDMEIVTIVLQGSLRHRDSMGSEGLLRPDEVQWMSAGRGIRHSEHNGSNHEALHLLQIWIETAQPGAEPAYGQRAFAASARQGRWQVLVAPDGAGGAMPIRQQAWIRRAELPAGARLELPTLRTGLGGFLFLIGGRLRLAGDELETRDAAEMLGSEPRVVEALESSDILLIEVPVQG